MNFTQQTERLHVSVPRVVSHWRWWESGHCVPTALMQQVLQLPQPPNEGAAFNPP